MVPPCLARFGRDLGKIGCTITPSRELQITNKDYSVIRVGIRIMIVVNMNIVDMEVVRVGEVAVIDGVDVA